MKNLFLLIVASAAFGAIGGERHVERLGGEGWKLWLDRKAEYQNDPLHLNPVDAARIREGRGDWLSPVDAKTLSVAGPTCGWDALFAKSVPWTEAETAWKDTGLSVDVSVPGTVEEYFFDAISGNRRGERESGDYRGVSWWGRKFSVPASAKGRRVALAFREGVRQRAEIFVNRRLVGYEMVLQSPFEVDVSDAVNYGGVNELAVRITDANGNFSWGDYTWTRWGGYLFPLSHGFGGILGGIDLVVTDQVRIDDVFVRNKPKPRDIDTTVEIANGSDRDVNLSVVASIVENWSGNATVANPKTLFSKEVGRVSVPARGTKALDFNAVVRDAKLWEIHDSHLYDMIVALRDASGALVDRYKVRFGFRFMEAKGVGKDAQLWLNGRRVFILSAISWGYWPSNGMYPTPELARKHVESARKLGMNMLNCHRCRGNHAILDAADEMGVMYYEEPGGHSTYRTKPDQNLAGIDQSVAHEICRQKLLRMVKDHRNHASLMMYNMVNEPGWEPDALSKEDMALAHLLDPTRLIVYGSGFMGMGRPEPRKLNMLPYSQTQNITGFTDVHNASASPGVYVDSNYSSPVAFARKERAETELFIWGEEGALAAPPQLELIESARKGKPNGWDGQQYGLWYEGYKSYLEKKRLTKNFPSITDLITSMGNVQYYEHGRLLENARIADGCEAYILNGYESMKDDNLSGCVDCYRNHKGDPGLVSKYMKPLVMSVKARDKLGATGDVNSLDLWVLNEYALEAGTYGVKAFVKTPRGKVREIYSGSVKISGGEKFSDLAAADVKVSFDDGPGYYRIAAVLSGKDGRRLAKGHDEMLAVDLKGGRIASRCAIVGGGPEYVKYAQSIGANLKPYDPAMGRLDGILLAPTDLGMRFRPIPAFNFRAKDGKTPGLNLDHFLGKKFETPVGERVSTAAIDFDLKSKLMPGYDIVGTSNFSVRWEGFVVSDHTGEIEFEYTCDDGARVWFGGELVVDKWTNGPRQTRTFKRNLVAGEKYALKIEAYQDGGDWLASFKWKLPLPDIKFDMADILRRVREDGTRLVLIEDAEGWLEKLRDAKAFPEYRVFHPHKTWVGHNLFVKDHPFFEGLPVNCAMNWEYQKLVVYDGPRHFGLVMDGEEALAGIVGVPLRGIATSVGIVPYGRGKIVFSSLDIAPNLASGDKSAVTPKRIFANILGWTGGSLQETSAFFSPGARAGGVKFQERFAPSEGFVNRIEKPLREEVCLNGRWDFQPVPVPKDCKEGKGVPAALSAQSAEFRTTVFKERWADGSSSVRRVDADSVDLHIDPSATAQTVLGFGTAVSELSWSSLSSLDGRDRKSILDEMFSASGGNFTIVRTPIGASDFSHDFYSYDEKAGDFGLAEFSIERDRSAMLPLIKEILRRSDGSFKVWASPWCPPRWMKKSGAYASKPQLDPAKPKNDCSPAQQVREGEDGFICDDAHMATYAKYFRRYIDAYRAEGVPIWMVMPQNEFNSDQVFPSCTWKAESLARFVGKHLGPALEGSGTEIFFGTMERPSLDMARTVLDDPDCRRYVKGAGFQWAGKGAIGPVHRLYPELFLMQTEQECGDGRNDWRHARHAWELMRHYFDNGASAYLYWNLSLEDNAMSRWGWRQNSLVSVEPKSREWRFNIEYFVLKHLSRYVKRGAKKLVVASGDWLAFSNPDGSIVAVFGNEGPVCERTVCVGSAAWAVPLPANSVSTLFITATEMKGLALTGPQCSP